MMWTTTGNLQCTHNAPFDFGVAMLPAKERRAPAGGGNSICSKING